MPGKPVPPVGTMVLTVTPEPPQPASPDKSRPAATIAICAQLAAGKSDGFGTFNFVGSGTTSWHGFAREIFRAAGLDVPVAAIPSRDFPQKAKRPAYSVLDCSKLSATIGSALPTWQDALSRYVPQIIGDFSFSPEVRRTV